MQEARPSAHPGGAGLLRGQHAKWQCGNFLVPALPLDFSSLAQVLPLQLALPDCHIICDAPLMNAVEVEMKDSSLLVLAGITFCSLGQGQ